MHTYFSYEGHVAKMPQEKKVEKETFILQQQWKRKSKLLACSYLKNILH